MEFVNGFLNTTPGTGRIEDYNGDGRVSTFDIICYVVLVIISVTLTSVAA
jgi:hypothetical protein